MKRTTRTRTAGAVFTLLALGLLPALPACSGNGGPNPSGTLEATTVDVAPLIAGRVLEMRADEGDAVNVDVVDQHSAHVVHRQPQGAPAPHVQVLGPA